MLLTRRHACSWYGSITPSIIVKQTISAVIDNLYTLRITACHRWTELEHNLPVTAGKRPQNSGYCHRLFFTTCHCLSSTIYLSLPGACPHWKEGASSRTISWKERASSRSRKHVSPRRTFTGHRSKYIRERAHAASVFSFITNVSNVRDRTNCK